MSLLRIPLKPLVPFDIQVLLSLWGETKWQTAVLSEMNFLIILNEFKNIKGGAQHHTLLRIVFVKWFNPIGKVNSTSGPVVQWSGPETQRRCNILQKRDQWSSSGGALWINDTFKDTSGRLAIFRAIGNPYGLMRLTTCSALIAILQYMAPGRTVVPTPLVHWSTGRNYFP